MRDCYRKHCKKTAELREEIAKLKKEKQELLFEKKQLLVEIRELKGIVFKTGKNVSGKEEQHPGKPKKKGAPFGHPGWYRKKPEIIDEEIDVHVKRCPYCGGEHLTRCANYDEHIQEDIVIPRVKAVKYRHWRYYCTDCRKISEGVGKDEIPGSYIGPVAKGVANYLRYKSGLSYYKIQDIFERLFSLQVVKASLYGFDNQVRKKSEHFYEEIKSTLKETEFLHTDETGWPNDGKNHWLWCMTNGEVVFYHIDKRRSSGVVKEIVGNDYKGIILSDFLSTYAALKFRKQKCLVHLLRILKRLQDRFPGSSRVSMFCAKMGKLTKAIIEVKKRKTSRIRFLEISGDIKSQIKTLLADPLPYRTADKFRKKLNNIRQELTTCLDVPSVPAHNNFVERQIRPNVISRKITFGSRSGSGMQNHQSIMSLIQTAGLNQQPVLPLLQSIHSGGRISLEQLRKHPP
jgi:transposase